MAAPLIGEVEVVEDERDERGSTGATRSPHVAHYMPHQPGALGMLMRPALERIDRGVAEVQLLVLTPDADTALEVAREARAAGAHPGDVLAVTSAARARRILQQHPPFAIAVSPEALVALLGASALKLGSIRSLLIVWADEILSTATPAELETTLAEVPKESDRVLLAQQPSPAIDAFIERYLRRARRIGAEAESAAPVGPPVALQYVTVAPGTRGAVVRRLLDELDPPSALLLADSDAAERDARETIELLGYAPENPEVRVSRGELAEDMALVVLLDLPRSAEELARIADSVPQRIVALVQPRQLDALRRLTSGGSVTPLAISASPTRARTREEQLRTELRAVLERDELSREILALEPLLGEREGVEIAAAALRLLERERAKKVPAAAAAPAARSEAPAAHHAPSAPSGEFTRIFLGVGERDGVRPGDIVGAITGEAHITGDKLGRIEVKDSFSLVEIVSAEAERVAQKMDGVMMRGRRVPARLDRGRTAAPAPRGRGERPERSGGFGGGGFGGRRGDREERGERRDRGDRGERGGFARRSERPGGDREGRGGFQRRDERGERGGREGRFGGDRERGGREGRSGDRDRGPRGPRAQFEREEWAERGDRMRHARRPTRRNERGPE